MNKKNIVVITAIKGEVDITYKDICLATWKHWADRHNVELIVLEEPLFDPSVIKPTWQRWFVLDLLENSNIEYNQVALIDVDTMVHWNAPNIFLESDNKFSACVDNDNVGWVIQSILGYQHFFPDIKFDWTSYFNCGMIVLNSKHKQLTKDIINFRQQHSEEVVKLQSTLRKGTDQTPVNYLVRKNGLEINLLNKKWNLTHLTRKEVLSNFMFVDAGWIWHFNGFDKNQRYSFMKQTWEAYGKNYEN